jgi:hypothetical protein
MSHHCPARGPRNKFSRRAGPPLPTSPPRTVGQLANCPTVDNSAPNPPLSRHKRPTQRRTLVTPARHGEREGGPLSRRRRSPRRTRRRIKIHH